MIFIKLTFLLNVQNTNFLSGKMSDFKMKYKKSFKMKYHECDVLWLTHVAIIISINQCEHNFQQFYKIYIIQTYRYILEKKIKHP